MPAAVSSHAESELPCEWLDRRFRGDGIEVDPASEDLAGREAAEDEIGVGDGRLRPATAVARGTRNSAGRSWTDMDARAVEPGDRPATGPDRADLDRRNREMELAHDRLVRLDRLAVHQESDVEARAAHVGRDQRGAAEATAHRSAGDDAADRTGSQRLDRPGRPPGPME